MQKLNQTFLKLLPNSHKFRVTYILMSDFEALISNPSYVKIAFLDYLILKATLRYL